MILYLLFFLSRKGRTPPHVQFFASCKIQNPLQLPGARTGLQTVYSSSIVTLSCQPTADSTAATEAGS